MHQSITFLFLIYLFLPFHILAQERNKHPFGDRLLMGIHIGFFEDYNGSRFNENHISDFSMARAGVSFTQNLYGGIQARYIRAQNFNKPVQNFYMAGLWVRGYLIHPDKKGASYKVGVFFESGYMRGNYAFEDRNGIEYAFEKPGSWFIPFMFGAEYRVWRHFTLELAINTCYNGENWDQKGIAYPSIGGNWHF